ncbi:MAG: leucine-rich repeat domain-containing protein [Oscillospiraceae bacterium]
MKRIFPDQYTSGDYSYYMNEDGSAAIFKYTGTAAEVVVPDALDGRTVTVIYDAFLKHTELTAVTLPAGLQSLGNFAFGLCTSLTKVVFPQHLETIGMGAFLKCTALAELDIPDSVISVASTVADETAWYAAQPDGILYLGGFAYSYKGDRNTVTSIEIAAGTKGIADSAFGFMPALERVTFPENLQYLGVSMFYDTPRLTELTIPAGVRDISLCAFDLCNGLKRITLPDTMRIIETYAFVDCENLEYVNIPEGVEYIQSGAFQNCPKLLTVTLPESVKEIESGAFYNIETDDGYAPAEGFTLVCPKGSVGEEYAKQDGIAFRYSHEISVVEIGLNLAGIAAWAAAVLIVRRKRNGN